MFLKIFCIFLPLVVILPPYALGVGEATRQKCFQRKSNLDDPHGDNFTLPKHLRSHLLIQVSAYLHQEELLLVTRVTDKGLCNRIGRSLYKKRISASCSSLSRLSGYQPVIVLIANEKDDGKLITQDLQELGDKVTQNLLTVTHIVVVLFSSRTVLHPPKARLRYCVTQAEGAGVIVREVFTFGPESSTPVDEAVGCWIPGNPRSHIPYRAELAVPSNFMGNTIRIAVINVQPYNILERTSGNGLQVKGYIPDLFFALQQKLNFTIDWVEALDGQWGLPMGNGSFTGLVGVLQRKDADIAAADLSMNIARLTVMDFSPPIAHIAAGILIYRSQDTEYLNWTTYIAEFSWTVWVTFACFWIIMAVGMVLVTDKTTETTLMNSLFIFVGIIAQQGSASVPKCLKGRIVFFTFWLASVTLFTFFSAKLTSHLTVVYPREGFSSMKEILSSSGYSIALRKGSSYITNLKQMRYMDEGMGMAYQQLMDKPELQLPSQDDVLPLLKSNKGRYAFFGSVPLTDFGIKDNSYTWVGPRYFKEYIHLGYMKNLSFSAVITDNIITAMTSGITSKLEKIWWREKISDSERIPLNLGFSQTVSLFVLLGVGILLGILILFIEKSWEYLLRPRKAP